MEVTPYKTRTLTPPQDDLLEAIRASALSLQNGDCVAISSKVVSIWEGRCVPIQEGDTGQRDRLAIQEATKWLPREKVPDNHALWTITHGALVSSAGIDASNANKHYILWPKHPQESATVLHEWLCATYDVSALALIITDSRSLPLRRGATGYALAWAGFNPLVDHRGTADLFGRAFVSEHTNLADALATAAVLSMGETDQGTPLARIRGAPYLSECMGVSAHHEPPYEVPLDKDMFAPFLQDVPWQTGGAPIEGESESC